MENTSTFDFSIMNQTIIFIDGSYYNFYRYFSIMNWWKNAFPDDPISNPIENKLFVDKFRTTFVDNIKTMSKKLNVAKDIEPTIIVGKDCKRSNIWRNELCKTNVEFKGEYKGGRKTNAANGFMGGPLFKLAYDEKLFNLGGAKMIMHHPKLEADDCIAISTKYILEKYPLAHIFIITSDKDYLQLACDRVELFDLSFKKLTEQKSCTGNSEKDLFFKIVMGDPSDNIKSVLKKCGPQTALKCYEDREYFEARLKKENAYDMYKFNKKMIDFNEIPEELVNEFMMTIVKPVPQQ